MDSVWKFIVHVRTFKGTTESFSKPIVGTLLLFENSIVLRLLTAASWKYLGNYKLNGVTS